MNQVCPFRILTFQNVFSIIPLTTAAALTGHVTPSSIAQVLAARYWNSNA
jgi:hypothetical protein